MLSLPFAFAVVQAAAYALQLKSGDEAYAGTLSFFVEAQASQMRTGLSLSIMCARVIRCPLHAKHTTRPHERQPCYKAFFDGSYPFF